MHIKHLDFFKFFKNLLVFHPKNYKWGLNHFHINLNVYPVWIFKNTRQMSGWIKL